jgi:hypothetical protein
MLTVHQLHSVLPDRLHFSGCQLSSVTTSMRSLSIVMSVTIRVAVPVWSSFPASSHLPKSISGTIFQHGLWPTDECIKRYQKPFFLNRNAHFIFDSGIYFNDYESGFFANRDINFRSNILSTTSARHVTLTNP